MASKSGGGNRKHGGNKEKPACIRYKAEMRWESNKRKAIARDKKRQARKAAKLHARHIRMVGGEV